ACRRWRAAFTTIPARSTLFNWLRQHREFARKYTFAKWFQCQSLADDMVDIADSRANDLIERERPDGKQVRVFDPPQFGLSLPLPAYCFASASRTGMTTVVQQWSQQRPSLTGCA